MVGAVRHSGDNLTGEGDGDDEVITVDFNRVGSSVAQIFFVINIYTRGANFREVANPYCRVLLGKDEVCKYQLREAPAAVNGLVICRFFRTLAGGWGFQALGQPSQGTMWRDSIPDMIRLYGMKQEQLFGAQQSSISNSHGASGSGGCCVTM